MANTSIQSGVTLSLPDNKPEVVLDLEGKKQLNVRCDTLVINTDQLTLHKIWRCGIPWHINDQRHGKLYCRGNNQ